MPKLTRDGYRHWLGRRNGVCLGQPKNVRHGKVPFSESQSVSTDSSGQYLEATTVSKPKPAAMTKTADILTDEQKQAFKEVFDLFDVNGGGTIDVGELDESLKSVGINVDQRVLVDAVRGIDEDGNDEIDFDEFLEMMTNNVTEIMGADEEDKEHPKNNRGVFFAALRQFMNWSHLGHMDEIEKFYQAKSKLVQPHVVGHYAAGARLIGLTDKQLIRHLKRLKAMHDQNGEKSPYAQPLLNLCEIEKEKVVYDKTNKMSIRKTNRTSPDALTLPVIEASPSNHGDSVVAMGTEEGKENDEKKVTFEEGAVKTLAMRIKDSYDQKSILQRNTLLCKTRERKDHGWISHRSRHVAVKLPGLAELDRSKLTTENLYSVRAQVEEAKSAYFRRMQEVRSSESALHWASLVPEYIQTRTLRRRFRRVFCDYNGLSDGQLPPIYAY